ncbi:MAG: primosome assembly protein PriA, partial [Mycobacteriales bacterium]
LQGSAAAVAELVAGLDLPASADLLGPVPAGDEERILVRVPRADGGQLAAALKAGAATRSARKSEHVRIALDPQSLA